MKVGLSNEKQFLAARTVLRKLAERDGWRCVSSRNADSTEAYFWLIKPEAKK